jgi:hypothetical protein
LKVSKTFRPYTPGQAFLLPPSTLDWLPEDHLARFIMDVVKKIDLAAVYERYEGDLRGYRGGRRKETGRRARAR